jgi:hypothetical protein
MHRFTELAHRAASFALSTLNEAQEQTAEGLQTSGATIHVKNLQMITLSKAIFAIGMFSIFEAMLQDDLRATNGFREARRILDATGEHELEERFNNYYLAINVLKHGEGNSYTELLRKRATLPFRVVAEDDKDEFEGDVSAINTLIDADDAFVENCGAVIRDVAEAIQRAQPGTLL